MKKGFTLIEVLLSIAILSILFLAMSNVLSSIKGSKKTLQTLFKKDKSTQLLIKTLYSDILNANEIKIQNSDNKNFIRLYLHTKNSLYNNIYPYVLWYVSKNENTLARAESTTPINLDAQNLYIDTFAKNLDKFKIYQHKGKFLIYLGLKDPLFFEIYNPLFNVKK